MDFIKEWSFTVCVTLIISVVFSVLTPRGSMGKFYKMILSAFIFLSFIIPFTDADISFSFPQIDAESEEMKQENAYSNMLTVKIKEALEKGGYKSCTVNSDIEYRDEEIVIKEVIIFIPDNYNIQEVKDYIFEKLGILAEVHYVGE